MALEFNQDSKVENSAVQRPEIIIDQETAIDDVHKDQL